MKMLVQAAVAKASLRSGRVWLLPAITLTIAATTPASAQTAEPHFAFRGPELGMSLSAFRATAFLDRSDGVPTLLCTGDTLPDSRSRYVSFNDVKANGLTDITGVTTCAWYRSLSGHGTTNWLRVGAMAAGQATDDQVFQFVSAEQGAEPSLFRISMTLIGGKHQVLTGLEELFGEPSSTIERAPGLDMDSRTWSRNGERITVFDAIDVSLTYSVRSMEALVEQRKTAAFGRPASGL